VHEGNGYHSYAPTQAETNYDHIAFTFKGTAAITATVQLYTTFPQTADAPTAVVTAAAVWDRVLTAATHNIATSAGRRLRTASGGQMDSGTAQAGSADSITLATSASTTVGLYVGCLIAIDGGTGVGQARYIVGYTGAGAGSPTAVRKAYVARHWTTAPDNTSTYVLYADNQIPFIYMGLADGGAASTITLDSGASATNDIYVGQAIRILSGVGDDQVRTITAYNGTTKVATVDRAWTTQPTSQSYFATLQTGPAHLGAIAVGVDLSAVMKTSVNTEVVDALATDTYAEPAQGTPAATTTLSAKIGYLYKAWRNKSAQTASQYSLYNDDAATVDHKATFTDDATTATRGEIATGP
jgi:hypothetical protein